MDFKLFTSSELKGVIKEWRVWMLKRAGKLNNQNNSWQLWRQHNKPTELLAFAVIKQQLDYIHNNLVEAGFVSNVVNWKYSSAIDYAGGKGLLDIKLGGE